MVRYALFYLGLAMKAGSHIGRSPAVVIHRPDPAAAVPGDPVRASRRAVAASLQTGQL